MPEWGPGRHAVKGFALAASNFRDTGYAVRSAAEDTENLRQIFIRRFSSPKWTIAFGQSFGGLITAKLAELIIRWRLRRLLEI